MSGSISGSLWGLVLGGVGLTFVSLVNEQPAGNAPPLTPQLTAPSAVQTDAAPEGLILEAPTAARAFDVDAPRVAVPTAEVAAPDTDTTPSSPPAAPDLATALTVPESVSNPEVTEGLEEPLISRTVTSSPAVPVPEQNVVIATRPAQQTPEPAVPDDTDVAGVAEDVAIVPLPEEAIVAPEPAAIEVAQADPSVEAATETTGTATEEAAEPAIVTEAPVDEDKISAEPAIVAALPDVTPDTPAVEPAPNVEVTAPAQQSVIDADAVQEPLPQVAGGVRVNRPSVESAENAGQDSEINIVDTVPDDATALQRYAAQFEATSDLPQISILLLDNASDSSAVARAAALPFPVTVVIDALSADANAQMRSYRDAGIEVVMQTSLPAGAIPTDVEVAFEAAFDILPETVALFSGGDGILQSNRAVTEQVIQVLQSDGRGLVVVQRGFGSALREAEQADLPAVAILRDLDGDGETAGAIARALDQAAFRARQSGDAVLLARITPETMDALQNWGAENDGDQIVLAPISSVLGNETKTE